MHLASQQPALPFTGRTPRSRTASRSGAITAAPRALSQSSRMLVAYLTLGPRTDLELAEQLGLPESRISARRSLLMTKHLVAYHDTVLGPCGAPNCRWTLTPGGQAVARTLQECS